MKFTIRGLCLVLFLAVIPTALASTTWYVDGVNGNDGNNCLSPTTACKTIGHAISLASSSDAISVAAATYTENLTIGISLKILGSGAAATVIDGGGVGSVAVIRAGSQVTLSNVTIQNGVACGSEAIDGGGIRNNGLLSIYNAVISGNFAKSSGGGIYNVGTLKLTRTTVSTNVSGFSNHCFATSAAGGGVYNSGTLTLSGSTISWNHAQPACSGRCPLGSAHGGGILNTGTLTVINSTVAGNLAFAGGGRSYAGGGGIYSPSGTVTISNSTVSGNLVSANDSAGGGISGSITLQNTIIAYNYLGNNYENCSGTMTSNGYNLSSDGTCNLSGPGDLINTDPMLGPLAGNGGPTQTMSLLSGSPAIDAGNPSGCTDGNGHLLKTDQRGAPRPDKEDASGCDIGAYESQID